MFNRILIVFLLLFTVNNYLQAEQCSAVFPDGIQNNNNGGKTTFAWGSKVTNSPDNILESKKSLNDGSGGVSCDTSSCSNSGSASIAINYPTPPNSNNSIDVPSSTSKTENAGNYENIILNSSATLNLNSGDYFLSGALEVGDQSSINIIGSGVVRIFVKKEIKFNDSTKINVGGDATHLLLYSEKDITLISNSKVTAFIYSKKDIDLNSGAVVNGAISGKDITLISASTVNFIRTEPDFGDFCSGGLSEPIASYHFDESSWSNAVGQVIDETGNFNGQAMAGLNTDNITPAIVGNPGTCRYGSFDGVDDYIQISDDPALDLPTELTITAWIKPDSLPLSEYKTILSKDENYEFHVNPSGEIYWWWDTHSLTTSGAGIVAGNWYHVAITYKSGKQSIYINGIEKGSGTYTGNLPVNNDPLHIGQDQYLDERYFQGLIDEIRIYSKSLNATDINAIYQETQPCVLLIAEYRMDETSWSGIAGEVVDQTGSFNAQARNGATTANAIPALVGNPGTCGYGMFDGVNDYVALPTTFENQQNSITITAWIKPKNTNAGSRIFADDENNNQQGYAFSLGDPGSGKLRFYSRGVNPVSVDTQNSVISTDTWTFVAAVHDSVAKTRKIYVNGVEQAVISDGIPNKNTYTGNWGVDTGIATIGGESDSGETGNRFTGAIDEVRMYQGALTQAELIDIQNETHPCAAIDHFEINHDGQGLTCQPENITIKACADVACASLYTGSADVDLSINNIVNKTVTVTGGSTITSFSYLDSITPATLSLDESYTCKNGASTSCDVVFAEAGFVLDINGSNDVASCDDSKSLAIKAVKLSDNGVSCAPAFTGNQSLNFAFNYQNPTTGTIVPKLSGTSMAASGVTQNRIITFNGNGEASLPIQYDDAGQLSFSVAEVVSSGVSSATLTKAFYPSKLIVSTPLSSTNSSGTVKQVAGENFPISIIAQCQGGTVTGNYSPQSTPQPNSTLQLSVQQKEPIANNGVLTLDSVSGSANIAATNLATTTWGNTNQTAVNFNAKYSEVGIINLAAQDLNYFGNAINSAGYSSAGRFIPDHFDVVITSNSFGDTCTTGTTDFTYIGQPFSYLLAPELLITAKNKSGQPTKNYTESGYQKLEFDDITRTFPTVDSTKDGLDLTDDSINNPPKMAVLPEFFSDASMLASLNDGVMKYTFKETDSFSYTKNANSKVDPFPMEYDIIIETIKDSDDVNASASLADDEPSSNTVSPTGVNLRFGRWNIENAFGPETSPLPMPMAIQYWNGSAFVVNSHDNCTKPNIASEQNTGTIWGGGLTAWQYRLLDAATGINEVITPIDIAQITAPSPLITVSDGIYRNFVFPSPSSGKVGSLNLEYEVPAWLKYDWQNNGNFDDNPSALATFGQFRGNDRIIYQREVH